MFFWVNCFVWIFVCLSIIDFSDDKLLSSNIGAGYFSFMCADFMPVHS